MEQKTPGVYINEINAFPNSVVGVATAIPVFIGYTQQASYKGESLTNKARRVESMKEFESFFGGAALTTFNLTSVTDTAAGTKADKDASEEAAAKKEADDKSGDEATPPKALIAPMTLRLSDKNTYSLVPTSRTFYLYNSIRLFYQNGGSTCYVISIGDYVDVATPDKQQFTDAIESLVYEQEPTMIVCPDALLLPEDDYYSVQQQALAHCASSQSRVALMDVYYGAVTDPRSVQDTVLNFRGKIGQNNLKYGVAYFPWVNTNVVSGNDVTFLNFDQSFVDGIKALVAKQKDSDGGSTPPKANEEQLEVPPGGANAFARISDAYARVQQLDKDFSTDITITDVDKVMQVHNTLLVMSPDYVLVTAAIARYLNTLPAAAAMAGVYTAVDNSRGVWKAPANVSLNSVVSPTVSLSDRDQEGLNVDAVTGKSVNAIRPFPGLGTLVWGARTLDGNSQDWRYVNVRRTMIMIEQSIKLACRAYVFEPNDANTWVTVQSMIKSFLFNLWKQGALAGASPDDAYSVAIGLGTTMTADDILNGYMNVFVKVAISRPAEFIILNFQQQMQKS